MNRMKALSLYRVVRRLHKLKLPHEMRMLGDQYLRQEFRAHKEVNESEFVQFMAQWEDYKQHLELEADLFGAGRDIPDAEIAALSDDQKLQLDKLRDSAMQMSTNPDADKQ